VPPQQLQGCRVDVAPRGPGAPFRHRHGVETDPPPPRPGHTA
jgi:hypothetical protein